MPFVSEPPPPEHRRAGTQQKKQENIRTAQSNRDEYGDHTPVCPEITFDTVPPVSTDLNQAPSSLSPSALNSESKCTAKRLWCSAKFPLSAGLHLSIWCIDES